MFKNFQQNDSYKKWYQITDHQWWTVHDKIKKIELHIVF